MAIHPYVIRYVLSFDPDFEVANDSDKVRCSICLTNHYCEAAWINRSSISGHTKSKRHTLSVAEKQQQDRQTVMENPQSTETREGPTAVARAVGQSLQAQVEEVVPARGLTDAGPGYDVVGNMMSTARL